MGAVVSGAFRFFCCATSFLKFIQIPLDWCDFNRSAGWIALKIRDSLAVSKTSGNYIGVMRSAQLCPLLI